MMEVERHPIIAHGELYVEPITKRFHPVNKNILVNMKKLKICFYQI